MPSCFSSSSRLPSVRCSSANCATRWRRTKSTHYRSTPRVVRARRRPRARSSSFSPICAAIACSTVISTSKPSGIRSPRPSVPCFTCSTSRSRNSEPKAERRPGFSRRYSVRNMRKVGVTGVSAYTLASFRCLVQYLAWSDPAVDPQLKSADSPYTSRRPAMCSVTSCTTCLARSNWPQR